MRSPTTKQIRRFWELVDIGVANEANFQDYIDELANSNVRIMEYYLDRGPRIIKQLKKEAKLKYHKRDEHKFSRHNYRSHTCEGLITDKAFPTTGTGRVKVRYSLITGEAVTHRQNVYVGQPTCEAYYHEHDLRKPTVAEVLLALANDPGLGMGQRKVVAHIAGHTFSLIVSSNKGKRSIKYTEDEYLYGQESVAFSRCLEVDSRCAYQRPYGQANRRTMSNPTYGKIIDPETYTRLMSQHVHIPESDQYICEVIERMSQWERRNVLEIGCGPARLTRKLARLGPKIILEGIDHDCRFLDVGREVLERMKSTVQLNFADVTTYIGDPKDIVVSQGMHHHIPKLEVPQYLQHVFDMLQPGGAYIVGDEFLAKYNGEADRRVVAVLWYCHVIGYALTSGWEQLATEEAKTLLDDLAMGQENPKTQREIEAILEVAEGINTLIIGGYRTAARALAELLLSTLSELGTNTPSGDARLDLSRGDFKVSGEVFRTEVTAAGFQIESSRWFGPIDVAGAMGVFVLRKP